MNPITTLRNIITQKWGRRGQPSVDEVFAAVYDPDTNSLKISGGGGGGGAGKVYFDAVVAPSGGDYASVGDAIAAGKTSIFVKNGTYNESTITTSANNLTIVGESRAAIINIGGTTATFSGAHTLITGVTILASTGKVVMSGAYSKLLDSVATKTGASGALADFLGDRMQIIGNVFNKEGAHTSSYCVKIDNIAIIFSKNVVNFNGCGNTVATAALYVGTNGYHHSITENTFERLNAATGTAIGLLKCDAVIHANKFLGGNNADGYAILLGDYNESITSNYVNGFQYSIGCEGAFSRRAYQISSNMFLTRMYLEDIQDSVISNNYISNTNPTLVLGTSQGISFVNNRIRSSAINFLGGNTSKCVLIGNIFNTGASIYDETGTGSYKALGNINLADV